MPVRDESERLTRKKRIDPKLKSQGWVVVAYDDEASLAEYDCHAIVEYPTDAGPADYAQVLDGQILALILSCWVSNFHTPNAIREPIARDLFAGFGIPDGDMGRCARELPGNLRNDFVNTMKLLRDEKFQALLNNYPRSKDPFVVAEENVDYVVSEYLIRDGLGNEYKPEDYLALFARFVEENKTQIDAIEILLNRPAAWSPTALIELRDKLQSVPERFTIMNLQIAHEANYNKALVDVISMVKHATDEAEPLYTAEERVDKVFAALTVHRGFTREQQQWLDRIRQYLIENLSIDQDDFDVIPVLQQSGGWSKADKVLEGRLDNLLKKLNEGVAL